MMVRITKDGFNSVEWNKTTHQNEEVEFNPVSALRECVESDDGITLGDIIRCTYKDEFLRVFIGEYSGCDVSDFYKELQRGTKPIDPNDDVQYCTVAADIRIDESTHRNKTRRKVSIQMDFGGRGKDHDNTKGWSLSLSPLADIAELPFILEKNSTVLDHNYDAEIYNRKDELEYSLTLLDVLDGIFYDLSFHGSPSNKANVLLNLNKMMEEIKDGTAKTVPSELDEETIQ